MNDPLHQRSSGVLLHPTCLPGPYAHGDIGPSAREFVNFLHAAGQTWWQMLPVHPTGGADSPYDSPSAFAGNDALVSLEDLAADGLLSEGDVSVPSTSAEAKANFSRGQEERSPLLRRAFTNFRQSHDHALTSAYDKFLSANGAWAWDYALFMVLRESNQFRSWVDWTPDLRSRSQAALDAAHIEHKEEVLFHIFRQFVFHRQWDKLRTYARGKGVRLMGDLPMFVSHNSVDVWANQEMFYLDEQGNRTVQAGVPPDYFSADGQLWGNPLYRWDHMQADGYGWWIDRLRRELDKFDAVRLDHFIAFSRYWEIPMGADTAKTGRYVDVPGSDFLSRAREALGGLPLVAEDLGVVTEAVEKLRDDFALPGMKILQFAFWEGAGGYLPHNYTHRCVAYLGTHDNDTTRGWYENLVELTSKDGASARDASLQIAGIHGYTGTSQASDINERMLHALFCSPADTVIVTAQDLLDLNGDHRMNVPGVAEGNWTYRLREGALNQRIAERLRAMTSATERCPQT